MKLRDALARLQAVAAPSSISESQVAAEIAVTPPDPNLCQYCGETITWRRPDAVAFGDCSSAHVLCYEQAELARVREAAHRAIENPHALINPAKPTICAECVS